MEINIIRSPKRRRTVSARLLGQTLYIQAPIHIANDELNRIAASFQRRFERKDRRTKPDNRTLIGRAKRLTLGYFKGELPDYLIAYTENQRCRFGSCNSRLKNIWISARLAATPPAVLDYVIIHELAHLLVPSHSQKFWALVYRFKKTDWARGYLAAFARAQVA